uniref:TMH4C4 n=1 Tax=Escherichia coli TaxID=562 RepID=UPI0015882A5E|nr:Chain A, TMH4C4 [Escherichia coli]6M6Z_B Chain B, TMH4C4 [Escherichia coli]6M6Z_C Chain C, TMH4C4 [Escherichia coli]6M6Z_D Chain D, TMH4C4 [Escherichia coli]
SAEELLRRSREYLKKVALIQLVIAFVFLILLILLSWRSEELIRELEEKGAASEAELARMKQQHMTAYLQAALTAWEIISKSVIALLLLQQNQLNLELNTDTDKNVAEELLRRSREYLKKVALIQLVIAFVFLILLILLSWRSEELIRELEEKGAASEAELARMKQQHMTAYLQAALTAWEIISKSVIALLLLQQNQLNLELRH